MKKKLSLSLKLTLIVVFVSAIIIFSLTYINLREEASFFEKNYVAKAVALAKSLDASIGFHNEITKKQELQQFIINISRENSEIIKLSINVPTQAGMNVFVSTDETLIDKPSDQYNNFSYERDSIFYVSIHEGDTHMIRVIAPMNISGQKMGTYELLLSMDTAYAVFDAQMRTLITVSMISLFVLIFSSLVLLQRTIVKPIRVFRRAARRIGEGNLDEKIKISSRDELGELAAAFNQMTSDLKKSRAQIEKYNKTLEGLLDQKDEFIMQLGHDLKNPLTPLVGLLPILAEEETDPTVKEQLQIMVHNVEYMRELILNTLELARLRSPNTTFDLFPLKLQDVVVDVLENQQFLMKDHKIKVENNIDGNIVVNADKLRLVELCNNLISNAIKYTPKEGGTITLDARQSEGFVTVSVKDTGIGMTAEQLEQIFDEFYRVDASRHEMDSSGLGLSICKRIVEKHGGRIWAESPGPELGSTFFFTLPIGKKENV